MKKILKTISVLACFFALLVVLKLYTAAPAGVIYLDPKKSADSPRLKYIFSAIRDGNFRLQLKVYSKESRKYQQELNAIGEIKKLLMKNAKKANLISTASATSPLVYLVGYVQNPFEMEQGIEEWLDILKNKTAWHIQ